MVHSQIWRKLRRHVRSLGSQFLYSSLLLYYAFKRSETPSWAKNIIRGIGGYFVAPIDSIPDMTPILGFTDDFSIISFGLVTLAAYIDQDVRIKARKTLKNWTGELDLASIRQVDAKL